jgi:MFS family permease
MKSAHPPDSQVRAGLGTFSALRSRNFRLWFFGQTVSMMGTWMQSVAQGWLVYQLTGSELALGLISFLGTVPTLFLMIPAGALLDRANKRNVLVATQTVMMLLAFTMAGLYSLGVLAVWHIGAMAILLGIANSFDAPARQALAVEMVDDRRDLMNAIALNSTIFNLARVVGPAIGGIVLATLGAAWCFGLNGMSFLAVLLALLSMRLAYKLPEPRSGALLAHTAAGLDYIWSNKVIRAMIVLLGFSSLFGFSYSVLLPAFAEDVLHVGKAGLGELNAAVGLGALVGSLVVASLGRYKRKALLMTAGTLSMPLALLGFSQATSFPLSLACLVVVGFAFVSQNATINTLIQSLVPDELRGRVMAVYSLMFFGTTPFGSLLAGSLAESLGTRQAVTALAGITLFAGVVIFLAVPSLRRLEL